VVYIIVVILILLSGLFSGLTLGFLGLNKSDLETKMKAGDKRAKKIYSVRKKGNLLLCTLLVGNVGVNSTIALLLGSVASGVIAGFVATGLIVIFGEIVPQAVFSRHAFSLGVRVVWLVKILIFVLYPICFPIAWVLDKILGEEMPTIWSKDELIELIRMHKNSPRSSVDADEKRIVEGALTYSSKTVKDIMTPRNATFLLDAKDVLDEKILNKIKKSGFTRIPVLGKKGERPVGILYVKSLLRPEKKKRAKDICKKEKLLFLREDKNLDTVLNQLIAARRHMAFVISKQGVFLGVVTLEDVIEEVLAKEITDESDKYVAIQKKTRKRTTERRKKRRKK